MSTVDAVPTVENDYFSEFEWGYGKTNGPHKWKLLPECERIRRPLWGQSPINIVTKDCVSDQHYYQADAQYDFRPERVDYIENTGRTWQIVFKPPETNNPDDWSYCDGTMRCLYSLASVHMHWGADNSHGSEHYIDGIDYAAEVHFVYFNQDFYDSYEEAMQHEGGVMIQAMLFELGDKGDPGLDSVISLLPYIQYKGQKHNINQFDPFSLLPNKTREDMYSIYQYYGSLCQPPCIECATWIIFKKTRTISKQQLDKLRRLHTHPQGSGTHTSESFIRDNRRVRSLADVFPLHVQSTSIDYTDLDPDESAGPPKAQHWQGTNYREVVSSEAVKPWQQERDTLSNEPTITASVQELLKPHRKDCAHFNCQFREPKLSSASQYTVYDSMPLPRPPSTKQYSTYDSTQNTAREDLYASSTSGLYYNVN